MHPGRNLTHPEHMFDIRRCTRHTPPGEPPPAPRRPTGHAHHPPRRPRPRRRDVRRARRHLPDRPRRTDRPRRPGAPPRPLVRGPAPGRRAPGRRRGVVHPPHPAPSHAGARLRPGTVRGVGAVAGDGGRLHDAGRGRAPGLPPVTDVPPLRVPPRHRDDDRRLHPRGGHPRRGGHRPRLPVVGGVGPRRGRVGRPHPPALRQRHGAESRRDGERGEPGEERRHPR